MRLICPNCSAQYEVDDSVVPEAGRDVQCSACGHTWFQPSRSMLEAAAEAAAEAAESPQNWDVPEPAADAAPAMAPDAMAAAFEEPAEVEDLSHAPAFGPEAELEGWGEAWNDPDLAPEGEPEPARAPRYDEAPPEPEAAPHDNDLTSAIAALMSDTPPASAAPELAEDLAPAPAAGTVPRRPLDDSLLAVLREEAEREAAARRAEGSAIETQEEMNLEPDLAAAAASRAAAKLAAQPVAPAQPAPTVAAARRTALDFSDLNNDDIWEDDAERVADLTEGEDEPHRGVLAHGAARRQMLPDIEEINSSLRASADRAGEAAALDTPQHRAQRRSGFRLGFLTVLGFAVLTTLLYAFAPRIGATVPALAPLLEGYVASVNEGRIWLDDQLRAVIDRFAEPPRTPS